ncbi:MAG: FtsX-like permease family protein [Bacteroidales bacterium]|jgi:putative ABC transport system permease protein|nr:FtsX-like permease family protein [Bacteroidales bacterium]
MNIFRIGFKNAKDKPLSTILSMVLFATGVFIISFLLLMKDQLESHLERNVAGINLVVGAKGSPIQLILSSIYHIDYPTGNISYTESERLGKHPLIARTISLALGDNYKGYRIVGTTKDYADLYHGELHEGNFWKEDFEVTIGAKTAEVTGLKVGDHFAGVHGFIETDHVHDHVQYKVAGIFDKTETVLDQLILTNISSVWRVHGDEDMDEDQREITSMLVFYRNAMGAISLPRYIYQNTNMQAASPAVELNRLYSLLGAGAQTVSLIAYLIILISGLSIFVSLLNVMKERKYELALIRVMGGGKMQIFALVVTEGLIIAFSGCIIGLFLSKLTAWGISLYTEDVFHYGLNVLGGIKNDLFILAGSFIVGFLASVLPAIKALKTNISKTLSE